MTAAASTELFDRRRHDVAGFACGVPSLDEWLKRYAGQGQRRDTARTFVIARAEGLVAAYYTLVVGQVDRQTATAQVAAGTAPGFPIPICLIARLAVDRNEQGRGLGARLLLDALRRVLVAADQVAIRAVVVDAIDDRAAQFYEHFGFQALSATPRTLMVPLQTVRAVLTPG